METTTIKSGANRLSMKALREKEKRDAEEALKKKCEALAIERYGEVEVIKMSNENKGLWFLPVCDDDDNIEVMALMKPIDRAILSYASTKITDEGIWEFFHCCLDACFITGDRSIIDDDNYSIPACGQIQKIIEGKKAYLLKR